MRSTFYVKRRNLERLYSAAQFMKISLNELIMILLLEVCHDNNFNVMPFQTIKYQKHDPLADWEKEHLNYKPMVYEKVMDLKRNFKFSISWLISFCIRKLLDKIVKRYIESGKKKRVDNYDRDFTYIIKMLGAVQAFMTFWGKPDKKYLESIYRE